jgi:hypothetical protein
MPNLPGDKFAAELINIRPDIPILLCTGFSEAMSEEKAAALVMEEQDILTMLASHPSKSSGGSRKELRQWNKVIFGFAQYLTFFPFSYRFLPRTAGRLSEILTLEVNVAYPSGSKGRI